MTELSSEGRRALILALEHGGLTPGRRGFYPGFTTTALHRRIHRQTVRALEKQGWLERDTLTGRMRLTDRGRIAAQNAQRELQLELTKAAARKRYAPNKSGPDPAPPLKPRLPYADN